MKITRWIPINSQLVCLLLCLAAPVLGAATFQEDFSHDPALDGWRTFGDTNLFHWNSTNQNLEVTWDSSQTNSYFYHSIGTILAKDDDFSLSFDLQLSDAVGGGFGFELAFGFFDLDLATGTNFIRGTGYNSPNLAEFDYFPAASFDPTVSTVLVASSATNVDFGSNQTNYSTGGFTDPVELSTTGDTYHVEVIYTATNQTLHTVLTEDGTNNIPIVDAILTNSFPDFRAGTVSISSYNDAQSFGSVLAHGVVDNVVVTVPDPIKVISIVAGASSVQAGFAARTNWIYTLQRTVDLQALGGCVTRDTGV